MIITDLLIVTVFTVILMVALWLFMSRMADESVDSQTTTAFAIMLIGISVFAFLLWVFWR